MDVTVATGNGAIAPTELVSLELTSGDQIQDDDLEETEIAEDEKLHLKKVSSLVDAAYQKVERYSRDRTISYLIKSAAVSERSSCASTQQQAASLPDSLDGGKGEVRDLIELPPNFESALRMSQALQRRFSATLTRLEKTLEENLKRQDQLKDETEEQGFLLGYDKDSSEAKYRYNVKPSSFAAPYFKNRNGTPAPMNSDSKYKVDKGFLDLYTTKSRTWLTSEHNILIKEVQKACKEKLIKDWNEFLRNAERRLKTQELTEEEKQATQEEIKVYKNHINFFTNVEAEKIDTPKDSQLDWDVLAANAFDGHRSPEECQLAWENFLHPSINRGPWTEEEDIQIQNFQLNESTAHKWKEIAEEMNTGRTPFQIMQRWSSFINPTLNPAKWTPESSKKLEDTVNMLRVGVHIPWTRVAQHLDGYTKTQLQSRWSRINPEQCKGPFTSEEDFVLIKGLCKFGMNFQLIAHFMPGRTKPQVRDRFKRALLPGLTWRPWSCREDKKIMANCSMASQHWRKMALVLPKRDTCEIRLRFYTLHVWQSLFKQKVLPPPLFPVALTKRPKEIKQLREKIIKSDPEANVYLEKVSKQVDIQKAPVKSFEARRAAIRKRRGPATVAKLLEKKDEDAKPRVIKRRRGPSCGVRIPSWPDMALMEYFLPGRMSSNNIWERDELVDAESVENMKRISRILQLSITHHLDDEDIEQYWPLGFTEQDSELIRELVTKHTHIGDYEDRFCDACNPTSCPESMPMIPPNQSTVGAFRSLLLHKQKLKEMASKEFLLFRIPHDQLTKLGDKRNTMSVKKKIKEADVNVAELELNSVAESEDGSSSDTPATESSKKKRKAAEVANLVNMAFCREDTKRDTSKPTPEDKAIALPTQDELDSMFRVSEPSDLNSVCASTRRSVKEEDRLLFHRFLSIFFWPALFTLQRPKLEEYHLAKNLVEDLRLQQMETDENIFDPFDELKGRGKIHHLDIDEHAKLIKDMEAKRRMSRKRRKELAMEELMKKRKIAEEQGLVDNIDDTPDDIVLKRKSIIKLKRSLVMKKVWDGRRKGLLPHRTKRAPVPQAAVRSARLRQKQMQRIKAEVAAVQQDSLLEPE